MLREAVLAIFEAGPTVPVFAWKGTVINQIAIYDKNGCVIV
jgi:hypothetical protein